MKTLENMLEYAEWRLDEEIKNGEASDITYWHGYRDAVKAMMSEQPTNDPLTLDELREMDGEPVWVVSPSDGRCGPCWMVVDVKLELCREVHGGMAVFENYGETWLAYCRRPEGGR